MAEFNTYPLPDLIGLEQDEDGSNVVLPGKPVRHKDDKDSYGTCISRRWIWDDKPMQCEVLWSKQPRLIQINVQSTPVRAQPRKLRATWTPQEAEPLIDGGFVSKTFVKKHLFDVEEEYENLSYEQVQKFHEEGADVRLHSDGRVTVRRKTDEPPKPEEYEQERILRRSISFRR